MKDIIHCRLIEWYLIFAVLRGLVYQRSVKCPDDDIIAAIFITLLQYTQLVLEFVLSVKIKKYENFFLILLSIWWALFLYFEKYMYDTDSIFGYIDAKFVSFNHVFYDINNILCLTPINRLLFSSKPGHSFDVYCYSRLLVGFFSAETVFMNWWVLLPIWLSQKAIFSHQIRSDQLRQHFVWGQCFTSVSPCP